MKTITFGGRELQTSRPEDLDARLVKLTGCSSAEIDRLVAGTPHLAAAALMPFLGEGAPRQAEIARGIAAGEISRAEIRALYGSGEAAEAAAASETGNPGRAKADPKVKAKDGEE